MTDSLARIKTLDRRRRTAVLVGALVVVMGLLAIATMAGANHVTTAGDPELFNLEHVYNFNPGDHEDRGGLGSTVGSDVEMFSHSVPLRNYETGQLVDAAGNPVTEPVYAERDFAVMGSYDRGGYIFDITDPENPEFVNVAPCRQPRNDVGVRKFFDPVTGQDRVVLALSQQTGTPCPNLDTAGGGDPAGVQINSGPNAGDVYDAVQWGDTAPLANQTANFRYAGTGCSDAQYAANNGGDPLAFQGKIAIVTMRIDRATGVEDCPTFTFFQKVRAAENAGAIGFVQVDEDDIPRTGVTAVTAAIPGVEISNSEGLPIVDQLLDGTTVNATLTPGTPTVAIFGNAAGSGGIGVFDITDPYNPGAMYRVMTTADGVHNFIFHPTAPFGYVSPGELPGGIQDMPIIDFTNLDAPTIKEGLDTPQTLGGIHDMELSITGDRIYAASENNYHILDNTDPGNPMVVTNVESTPLNPPTVPTSGSYAHGAYPDSAKEIMLGQVESIVAGGFLAPGTCPGEGLAAYDISGAFVPGANEVTPVGPIGVYNPPVVGDPAPRFCTSHFGRFVPDTKIFSLGWYVAGVRIVDFSDPFFPEEIATAVMADNDGTSNTWAAKIFKGYVYAGDMERGFDVFKWAGEGDPPWENKPPVANDDTANVAAAGSVNVAVKDNDSDPDNDKADLTVSIVSNPQSGEATVEADGTVTYTHNGDGAMSDSFVYRLSDPAGGSDTATVSVTIDQAAREGADKVTGGGYLLPTDGKKLNFGFNAKVKADGLSGNLTFHDKSEGIKVKLTTVTSLTGVRGECGEIAGGDAVEFTGTGTFNDADAAFRVCVADLGEPGNSGAGGADMFYLECTDGCSYSTGDRTADDVIDGGNIQVHDSSNPEPDGQSAAGAMVLGPMTTSESSAGVEMLTLTVYDVNGEPLAGADVTLESTSVDGSVTTLDAVTDATGLSVFTVTVTPGEVEHIARSGDLTSNVVEITGLL